LKQGEGHIINMSSIAGWISPLLYSVYAATKFGVRGFTDALRREVRPLGIQVSGIYPGPATTEFGEHAGKSTVKQRIRSPKWTQMTSGFVARKVVDVVKRPRRNLILPWWFAIVIWLENHFPRVSDLLQSQFFNRYRS